MEKILIKTEHRGNNSTTFTGRPQGKSVRLSLNLSKYDKDSNQYEIVIPRGTTSFNSSFYLGLFFESIEYLKGVDNFKMKYTISFEDNNPEVLKPLKENFSDCERQASNEYKRKTGLD